MKQFLKKVFIFFLAIFTILIVLELIIKTFYPQKISPNITAANFGLPNSLKSNIHQEKTNSQGIKFKIITNDNHIRRAVSTDYKKPNNLIRILVLGDSLTFGMSVGNSETFSFYLEKALNEKIKEKKFEVLNSAVPGWGPLEYYFFLKNEGYKYNPDLVIHARESSDFEQLNTSQIRFKNSYIKKTGNSSQVYLEDPQIIPFKTKSFDYIKSQIIQSSPYEFLTNHSHFINLFRKRLALTIAEPPIKNHNDDKTKEFLSEAKKPDTWIIKSNGKEKRISGSFSFNHISEKILIEKTQEFAQKQGFKFLTFQLPYHFYVLDSSSPKNHLNKLIPQTPIFNPLKAVRLFQNKFAIPLFFPGDIHLLPSGHYLIAHLLFNYLATTPKYNFNIPKTLIPFTQDQIFEQISHSDLDIINKVKLEPFWEFTEAMIYKNQHQIDKAKKGFLNYIAMRPNDFRPYFHLGKIFITEKKYDKAANYFLEAKQKNNGVEKTKLNYFYAYASKFAKAWPFIQKGNLKKALPYLKELSQLKGHFQNEANNMLALYYLKQGDFKMATFYKNKDSKNKDLENTLNKKLQFNLKR